MCEQKPLVRYLAPCKGVQVQSRILDLTPWIPDSLYTISVSVSGTWIPTVNGIPDPLSCIPDFKAQVFGFHKKNFSEFLKQKISRHPQSLAWDELSDIDTALAQGLSQWLQTQTWIFLIY